MQDSGSGLCLVRPEPLRCLIVDHVAAAAACVRRSHVDQTGIRGVSGLWWLHVVLVQDPWVVHVPA